MKILFFIPSMRNKGGVERAAITLMNAMAQLEGLHISILTLNDNREDFAFPIDDNISVVNLEITHYKRQYIKLFFRLRKYLKANVYDAIILIETISLLFSFLPTILLKKKPKLVVWEHFNFKNTNNSKLRAYFRIIAAKYADLIVVLTERDEETWKKQLRINNAITYIYNISPYSGTEVQYSEDSKVAIAVGRFVPVKGFERLIEIWDILEHKYFNLGWKLHLVGYGEQKENLKALIVKKGLGDSIKILENQDMREVYQQAGVLCMTSYFEGLPMVLLEAQDYALPSIAFDIYSGPAEILHNGSGILVKDNNLEDYADELFLLLSDTDKRRRMSALALENSQRFSKGEIVKKWTTELKKLL
ncbi:glycosyltransferase family 4 protein [Riemerella columbina]|uniref:glycosyltransferase family 4 protein n=1 Tax=Riemerella columbina TaxID=103810 RepID=UPI00266EB877|nr:glycosyltransferase family 4 protein [Riemerella columbina]WKS94937.1 glycosyltransferase family 4 protein [Riemerella columbina]